METTSVADRIRQIICERKITKAEFARTLGITRNYVYKITGPGGKGAAIAISHTLAKLIEKEYGYPAEWVLTGELPPGKLSAEMAQKMMNLDDNTLRLVAAYLDSLQKVSDGCE